MPDDLLNRWYEEALKIMHHECPDEVVFEKMEYFYISAHKIS
jgi:hypothetical protein